MPNLDLSRVLPYFSQKQQEEQLKQYKLIQQDLERKEQQAAEKAKREASQGSHIAGPQYSKAAISMAMGKNP